MPIVTLKFPQSMTRDQANHAWSEGQKRFWVATPDFKFINIGQHSAVYPLHVQIDLKYGDYILGCGYGRNKLRRKFRIDLMGVRWL